MDSQSTESKQQSSERGRRRVMQGIVTSSGMDKTIGVRVERMYKHTKYKKYIRRHEKYLVHDEANAANVGDTVEIVECRPLSKSKRWRMTQVLEAAIDDGGDV